MPKYIEQLQLNDLEIAFKDFLADKMGIYQKNTQNDLWIWFKRKILNDCSIVERP